MPAVTKDKALELLTTEVREKLDADELLEVYNEVFPHDPSTEEVAHEDVTALVGQLVHHVNSAREVEEILDLWGLIFPRHHDIWYDDEDERLHYNEEAEALSTD